ncbi:MAG: hypothetical protein JWL85_889 [Candidatus Saccharibacteria bacterium]|nr:hypothetical protein [Candidatus Saccharibacteria bacterium]
MEYGQLNTNSNTNYAPSPIVRFKKWIIFGLVCLLTLITFSYISSHAYIEVNTDGTGEAHYSFLNQDKQKTTTASSSGPIKKLLKKGDYEVTVTRGDHSYFSVVKVGGFFQKTTVSAKLSPEKARKFVGDNPYPCMYYSGKLLLSLGCGDNVGNAQLHISASADQPAYTLSGLEGVEGTSEGYTKTTEGNLLLVRTPDPHEDESGPHVVYVLSTDLKPLRQTALVGLNPDKTYTIQPYKEGFVVYNIDTFDQILYYKNTTSNPETINVSRPQDDSLRTHTLSVSKDAIMLALTQGEIDPHEENAIVTGQLLVYREGQTKSFRTERTYQSLELCGNNLLCGYGNKQLDVYDIAGEQQKLLYTVKDVESIKIMGNTLLLVKSDKLVGFNPEKREGSIQYSYGDYKFSAITVDPDGYTLSLSTPKDKLVALRINPAADNTDSIDKKIAELQKADKVVDVSIYDKFIYITPDVGDAVYNEQTRIFGTDPSRTKAANNAINQTIDKIGIPRNSYNIQIL